MELNNPGHVNFISFFLSALSRLAYVKSEKVFDKYARIIKTIPKELLTSIGNLKDEKKIFNDDEVYKNVDNNLFYEYEGIKYINFLKLKLPKKINEIMKKDNLINITDSNVKIINLNTSNSLHISIIADKRMRSIFILFRGTSDSKAMTSWLKPSTFYPIKTCKESNNGFLPGVFKLSVELLHTIYYSVCYLNNTFLNNSIENKTKIFVTGHSLGGALSTIFSYLWIGIRKKNIDKLASKLSNRIICVTFGSPKVINKKLASQGYLELLNKKLILYKRVVSIGDFFTNNPLLFYKHPGTVDKFGSKNEKSRQKYDTYCLNTLSYDKKEYYINYNKSCLCSFKNDRSDPVNKIGMEPHGNYLYITYHNLFQGKFHDYRDIKKSEYEDTILRIMISYSEKRCVNKIGYLFLNDIRNGIPREYYKPKRSISYFKIVYKEDLCMNQKIFKFIIEKMKDLKEIKKETEDNILKKRIEKKNPYISRGRPVIDITSVLYPNKKVDISNELWEKNKDISFMCLTNLIR